jgi:hypothetical protein
MFILRASDLLFFDMHGAYNLNTLKLLRSQETSQEGNSVAELRRQQNYSVDRAVYFV